MTGTFEIVLRWESEDGQHMQQVSRKIMQDTVELAQTDVLHTNFIQMRSELAAARREGD
jgi:hypothetical protein